MSNFTSDEHLLGDILGNIGKGRIQLPDFQRGWVWNDDKIRSIIASVSQGFPIGAILTLEAGGSDIRFKTRPIEGAHSTVSEPDTLILDGQQRLTALFQAFMSGNPGSTTNAQNKEMRRYYYFDMDACLQDGTEREKAVLSCGKDKKLKKSDGEDVDVSSIENEFAYHLFPVYKIFDSGNWMWESLKHWKFDPEKLDLLRMFESEVIDRIKQYNIPSIHLPKNTLIEAICLIFEKVNTGGAKLTVFELLTAAFAAKKFSLRKDWEKREQRLKKHAVLEELENTSFLRTLTLLSTNAKSDTASCTRREILRLKVEEYKKWADKVDDVFEKVDCFLQSQKIFNAGDLPYPTQLVPLTAILADRDGEIELSMRDKIARWYWCGVFGEMYGASTDTRFANDLSEVTAWVKEEQDEPRTIREANFHENRLLELRTRNSAAYKGVFALLMRNDGCRDFDTGKTIEDQKADNDNIDIHIHHIFPERWCKEKKIGKDIYNSIINKTVLSAETNQKIGGKAPSEYLKILSETNSLDMDEILNSHLICADTLRNDDFDGFFKARKEALLKLIGTAMGKKPISREDEN